MSLVRIPWYRLVLHHVSESKGQVQRMRAMGALSPHNLLLPGGLFHTSGGFPPAKFLCLKRVKVHSAGFLDHFRVRGAKVTGQKEERRPLVGQLCLWLLEQPRAMYWGLVWIKGLDKGDHKAPIAISILRTVFLSSRVKPPKLSSTSRT